ncbi:MAG: VanZ family protein [Bacteroidota bacterium]
MKLKYFWKPVLWLALICYGLFMPADKIPSKPFLNIPHFDKLVHFALFFILCLLLLRPFKKSGTKYYLLAPVTAIILGLILELSQQSISVTRSSDLFDFLANTAGIVAAPLFYYFFVSNRKWEVLF